MAKKNNSKRKRAVIYEKTINVKEEGIEIPEFIKNLKNPRVYFRVEEYNQKLNQLKINLNSIILLMNTSEENSKITHQELNSIMVFSTRHAIIEYFVILDDMLNSVLTQFQREKGLDSSEIRYFQKVDDGLNEFISKEETNQSYDRLSTKIKHFRSLRNQFAHYQYGRFVLEAKQESFESFLQQLKGIQMEIPGGFHGYLDTKPGMYIPYSINSMEFLHDIFEVGTEFFKLVSEILLPDSK